MSINLRQIPRINYYQSEHLDYDGHIFCDLCRDYVFEYCSIHGPLLIIPDDKVPTSSSSDLASFVPRAAATIPRSFLHLAASTIPGAGIGVFATLTLPRGVSFGPYKGRRNEKPHSMYCWQLYDDHNRATQVVDAGDGQNSNWMRYINCARHWHEQNLVAYQYQGQIYYRTIKIIPSFTELMVFYGTEFANLLHIDLRSYNSESGPHFAKYQRAIDEDLQPDEDEISNRSTLHRYGMTEDNSAEHISNMHQVFGNQLKARDCTDQENSEDEKATKNTESNTSTELCKPNIVICNECHKSFYSKTSLIGHLQTHIQYNTNLDKTTDIESVPKDPKSGRYCCLNCNYSSNQKYRVKRHLVVHTGERNFSCELCTKKFASKSSLKRHLKIHYQETILPRSGESTKFKSHISAKKVNIICPVCSKKFSRNNSLTRHLKIHSKETILPRRYGRTEDNSVEYNSNIHQVFGNQLKARDCTDQKNSEDEEATKNTESNTSTDLCKPNIVICNECYKLFYSKTSLIKHLQTHIQYNINLDKTSDIESVSKDPKSGRYCCLNCNFSSNQKYRVKNHLVVHTGERNFPCELCTKKFSSKSSLKRHLKIHYKETILPRSGESTKFESHISAKKVNIICPVCSKKFSRSNSLKKHLLTVHYGERFQHV